jgi:two-component system response regulator AtoC
MVFGNTPAMQEVKRKIELISKIDVPVLLQGESGTGKDLCAQLIHHASSRSRNAFVRVNCPAIPSSLIETELFGYDKGAFTGATQAKQGRVEQAHLGTLVFDEVGSLDALAQSKLLQVLQDGTFTRVGGHEVRSISTRVVSIANTDLRKRVEEGTFRLDLLYRINAVTINLPPLRERRGDLPELIDRFSKQHANDFGMSCRPFSKGLLRMMHDYDWPGNIRQLDNMVRNYTLLGDEDAILQELTPNDTLGADRLLAQVDIDKPLSLKRITKKATHDLERLIIMRVLRANGWNRQKTAKWLQISYRSLLYKLNEVEAERGTAPAHTQEPLGEVAHTTPTACSLQA